MWLPTSPFWVQYKERTCPKSGLKILKTYFANAADRSLWHEWETHMPKIHFEDFKDPLSERS